MRILQANPVNLSQNRYQTECKQANYPISLPNRVSPSFRQAGAEPLNKMLENKDMQKLIAIATAAATAAVTSVLATFKTEEQGVQQAGQNSAIEQESIIAKLQEKLKQDDEIIQKLNARIEELEKSIGITTTSSDTTKEADINNSQDGTFSVQFPKKRGRLPKQKEELRKLVTALSLSENSAKLLSDMCKKLVENQTILINREEVDTNDLTNELISELKNSKDANTTDKVINDFNSKLNSHKRPRFRVSTSDANTGTDTENRTTNFSNGCAEGHYKYALPGTPSEDAEENLRAILIEFEQKTMLEFKKHMNNLEPGAEKPIQPRWMTNQAMGKIKDTDIIEEINSVKEENRKKKSILPDDNIHDYKNINKYNVGEVEAAVTQDRRFSYYFTIHGALRFVDRFVNFKSDVPISEQCSFALDKLDEIIQNAIKEEINVETYVFKNEKTHRKYYSIRLTIDPKYFDEDTKKIFGTHPLKIGICENQPDRTYYNKHNKSAVIHTIFPAWV